MSHAESERTHSSTAVRPAMSWIALLVLALALALAVVRMQPPPPKGADAPASEFSAGRALAVLRTLLAEEAPHALGSEANAVVRERIEAHLMGLGYDVQVQSGDVCREDKRGAAVCSPVHNVVTRLPGTGAGPALLLMAHYDSVPAGPGVGDDGASVAAILEMARIFQMEGPYRNEIILLFTDGEEVGLLGAEAFVTEHAWVDRVGVVVNLESRGSRGQSLMFETSPDNAWLIDAYAASVARPATSSLMYEIYRIMPNDTDFTVFKERGIAGVNSAFIRDGQYYHTAGDSFAHLSSGSVQHHGDSALAMARQLASTDLSDPPAGNAVYLDVLGLGVVRWPERWTIPLVAATGALLIAACWQLVRAGAMRGRDLLPGLLVALLVVIVPIALGVGLTTAIGALSGSASPWDGQPLPTRAALWAGALLCALVVGGTLGHRAGAWGTAMGVWILWWTLSLVLSIALVGGSIVLLLPALWAACVIVVAAFSGLARRALAREATILVAGLPVAAIWFQLGLRFEAAVGFELSPAVTLSVALAVSSVMAGFAIRWTRSTRWLSIAAVVVTVVTAGAAAMIG